MPYPPPGNLPNPGIEPAYLKSPTLAGRFFATSATCEALEVFHGCFSVSPSWFSCDQWYYHSPHAAAAAAAKSLQSYSTLCDPIDGSPLGFPVPGILQARTLEWVAFPSPMHESEK